VIHISSSQQENIIALALLCLNNERELSKEVTSTGAGLSCYWVQSKMCVIQWWERNGHREPREAINLFVAQLRLKHPVLKWTSVQLAVPETSAAILLCERWSDVFILSWVSISLHPSPSKKLPFCVGISSTWFQPCNDPWDQVDFLRVLSGSYNAVSHSCWAHAKETM
jgi:hypothetical protein